MRDIGSQIRYVKAGSQDAEGLAILHKQVLPKSFLGSLDLKKLKLIYKAILGSPHSLCWKAALEDGTLAGFILGTVHVKKMFSQIAFQNPMLMGVFLSHKLRDPSSFFKIFEIGVYPLRTPKMPDAELLIVGVHTGYSRLGLGRSLVDLLIREFETREVSAFKILVGCELTESQKFYESLGAVREKKISLHKGSPSWLYVKSLKG